MNVRPLTLTDTLYEAVKAIEETSRRIAVVVDSAGILRGTLTDGDIRRALLAGETLATLASEAMNSTPITAQIGCPDGYFLDLMKRGNVVCVPVVDASGKLLGLKHLHELDSNLSDSIISGFSAAVIMAGGEGTRLRPITHNIPKPMVEVGGIPVIERQVRRLAASGIPRCYISVNYLSHVIEDHFRDGEAFGVSIKYLRESSKMGTAGALSLLDGDIKGPVVVMNGDILTTSDFSSLHDYHVSHESAVTVSAVDYRVQIPYGVIMAEGPWVSAIEEKPSQRFLCNAGIYAVEPDILKLVPATLYNMTDLMQECIRQGRRVSVFPVHEYWSDIGTPDDLEKARATFATKTN